MAFIPHALPLGARSSTSAARPSVCMISKRKAAKRRASEAAEKRSAQETPVPEPVPEKKPAPVAKVPEPVKPMTIVDQYFPPASRNLAPHVVIVNDSTLVLDNIPVKSCGGVPAPAKDDDPDPANYASNFPKAGDTLNWAPHIGITAPKSSVGVSMVRVAEGDVKLQSDTGPDPALYEQYYPAEYRFMAPEIVIEQSPGVIGVEMKGCESLPPVAKVDDSVNPELYSKYYKNDESLHLAPHIDIYDGFFKVQMRKVTVDPEDVDRPPFESYPQYESFGGLNRAPVISMDSTGGGTYELRMTMEHMPSFASYNAAPVISFMGQDGRDGVKLEMKMIEGNDQASPAQEAPGLQPDPEYSASWKPKSKFDKVWV